MKRIGDVMTRQPWTVQLDDSLAVAKRMLAEREVHHLPVIDGGAVVGIVNERDLVNTERFGTVSDVLLSVPQVTPKMAIDEVLDLMLEHRSDAVVVVANSSVEGIFTATDAVRVLRDALRTRRWLAA